MAFNDPTMGVPTPTGTLQGVAAFNWDGANWQPVGRAGPSVATATGVLQGVAPFSWGGSAWSPVGRAQYDVPTPTGTLDGVAVFTWNGSAWSPVGGQPGVATPTGILKGVAVFSWDGSQWQPAGKAGPEVATPYGVLQGVALFNWSGSAWVASAGLPSLTLDFMTPGQLDSRITFTRASSATYTDESGVVQTAATNAPRWDYANGVLRGLLIEEQRTNSALQSGDLSNAIWQKANAGGPVAPIVTANQTVSPDGTTTASRIVFPAVSGAGAVSFVQQPIASGGTVAPYTFSVWLRGNVGGEQTYICIYDGISNYQVRQRVTLTTSWVRYTVTSGNLTTATWYYFVGTDLRDVSEASTAAGTIYAWGALFEQGAFPTSYIPTASAAVTRAADVASMPFTPAASGTWQATFIPNGVASGLPTIINGNAGSPVMSIGADSRLVASIKGGASVFSGVVPAMTFGAVNKAAFGYITGASRAAVNGSLLGANVVALTVSGTSVQFGSDAGANSINGAFQAASNWSRVLSDAELQQVTT